MRGAQQILVPGIKTEQGHNALLTRQGVVKARVVIDAQIMLEPQLQKQIMLELGLQHGRSSLMHS